MAFVILQSTLSPVGVNSILQQPLAPPSPLLARKIDPETGDYESLFEGRHPIDDQVIVSLRTERSSGAAVTDTGQRFSNLRKITDGIQTEIRAYVQEALRRLITNGDIRLVSIDFEDFEENKSNQTVIFIINYQNLRTGVVSAVTAQVT